MSVNGAEGKNLIFLCKGVGMIGGGGEKMLLDKNHWCIVGYKIFLFLGKTMKEKLL